MKCPAIFFFFAMAGSTLHAQGVDVADAWARTSVQGQKATAAFMKITAKQNLQLVAVSSPVAGVVEVHQMKMENDIMRMRAVTGGLDLPAGKTVALTPGGYHLMVMDLKMALPKGSTLPLTLVFKDANGAQSKMDLRVPVAAVAPTGPAPAAPVHKH